MTLKHTNKTKDKIRKRADETTRQDKTRKKTDRIRGLALPDQITVFGGHPLSSGHIGFINLCTIPVRC